MPVEVGILVMGVLRWHGFSLRFSSERIDYWLAGSGVVIALILLGPSLVSTSDYGPIFTVAQMREMPEFYPGWPCPFLWFSSPRVLDCRTEWCSYSLCTSHPFARVFVTLSL